MTKYLTANEITSTVCDSPSQEVTIQFDREGVAHMYVSYNSWVTKMRKKVEESPDLFKCRAADTNPQTGAHSGYFFEFPSNLVCVRSKNKEVSEEVRKATAERFKRLHAEGKIKPGRKSTNTTLTK